MRKLLTAAALLLAATVAPAHALEIQGRLVQGGMVIGTVTPGSEVTLDGSAVAVNDNGRFVIGFGRDYKDSALLAVIDPQTDEQDIMPLVIEPRDYDIQRIDGLPPGKVTGFSEATLKRIRAENAQVASARPSRAPRRHRSQSPAPARGSEKHLADGARRDEPPRRPRGRWRHRAA